VLDQGTGLSAQRKPRISTRVFWDNSIREAVRAYHNALVQAPAGLARYFPLSDPVRLVPAAGLAE